MEGPFIAGDALSLADLHAYPSLCYFALVPDGKALLERFPAISQWFATMASRRSVLVTMTQYESTPQSRSPT